ncbi:DUF6639 family protein [Marinobacterium sp. YM272]|uniref:DUF6639 family protein n=1 Tax=Marinobacterium sp. YM272 TaxID=3421654 RepID=UPI003D7F3ABB
MPLPGAALLVLSLMLLVGTASAEQRVVHCPDQQVEIQAVSQLDAESICTASADALAFLAKAGVKPNAVITIEMVEQSLEHYGSKAFGSFDQRTGHIRLMSVESIQALITQARMFDQVLDEEHYRGLVAHEIAHALFHQNGPDAQLSNAAQEYLAYVTQLAVLSAERRRQIIARADVEAWAPGDEISEIYMAFAPQKFAVKSYLHFVSLSAPVEFVKMLLNVKWFYISVP